MLLSIDIGNTSITLGLFRAARLIKRYSLPTKGYAIAGIKRGLGNRIPDAAVICSVVPHATRKLAGELKRLGLAVYIIGRDIKVPVRNLYRDPKQVGLDRLVNAYAGIRLYGAPLVVVDFGTAVTFDAISKNKEYLGGMILPGMKISLEALNERTALLPKIGLAEPEDFIGKDTKNSMLSGLFYGFGSLTAALSRSIKGKIGRDAKVILTGGNAAQIAPYCKGVYKVDPDLTLKGIFLLTKSFLGLQ